MLQEPFINIVSLSAVEFISVFAVEDIDVELHNKKAQRASWALKLAPRDGLESRQRRDIAANPATSGINSHCLWL